MLRGQQVYAPDPSLIADEGRVSIGRRLFATLPEDAHDRGPVIGGGGRWTLVADVRLDARDELCEELGIDPAEADGMSDAAVIMRSIERWEEDAIPKLVGDFAIILWDAQDHRLILARDFLGNRPLHYHHSPGFFAVASMPKGLHALPEVPREPNERAVAEFIGMFPEHGSSSYFRHVERVVPGEILVFSAQGIRRRDFWDFPYKPLRLRDQEYVEAVREVFDRAVAARLRGAGNKIAAHLSGGLDSSAVAATAARVAGTDRQVIAFTAAPPENFKQPAFPNRFNDESAHAAELAAMYPNIEHVIVRAGGKSPLAALDRNFFLLDRPLLNLCNGVWVDEILELAKARGLQVLLTGDMGNMTTSYDGFETLAQLLAGGRFWRLVRQAALLNRNGMAVRTIAGRLLGAFLPRAVWEAAYRLRGQNFDITNYTALSRDCADKLERDARALGISNSRQPWRNNFAVRKTFLRRTDLGNHLKGALGGWGVDLRDPTSDQRVVELCLSIPPEQFIKGGQTRSLARRAFADRLPQSIVRETRSGYQGADWHVGLRSDWDAVRDETDHMARLPTAAAIIDVDRLRRLVEAVDEVDWTSRQAESSYRLALLRGISGSHFLRRASGAN